MNLGFLRKRIWIIGALVSFSAVFLAACQPAAPTATQAPPTPTEEMVTPSVSVEDQEIVEGTVTVAEVVSEGPGWMVVHSDQEGAPGPVVGHVAVSDGNNENVIVEIDTTQATGTLYAMLHTDADPVGTYDFPGDDVPVRVNDQVVLKPFAVSGLETGSETDETTVAVVDFDYEPKELTVSVGTTVVFKHEGNIVHTVSSDDDVFESGDINNGDVFEFTFTEPGTYSYYCVYHGQPGGEGMAGTIIVMEE